MPDSIRGNQVKKIQFPRSVSALSSHFRVNTEIIILRFTGKLFPNLFYRILLI
jgi:hypothetical protein